MDKVGALVATIHHYECCNQLYAAYCSILHFLYRLVANIYSLVVLDHLVTNFKVYPFVELKYITLPKGDPLAKKNTS